MVSLTGKDFISFGQSTATISGSLQVLGGVLNVNASFNNDDQLTALPDGNVLTITFDADIATQKVGKNDNLMVSANADGLGANMVLRLIKGSSDDVKFNGLLAKQLSDLPAFHMLSGKFTKRVGDGKGNITHVTYLASGITFKNLVDASDNAQGDTEQAVSVYRLQGLVQILTT